MPGPPGPPVPSRNTGVRALLVGVSIAVVVLLVAGGLVVWNLVGGRPYASLPTCRQLLNDIVDDFPHAESPRVEGEYFDHDEYIDEYDYTEEGDLEGIEGVLTCSAEETADTEEENNGDRSFDASLRVNVTLYDAEDERVMEDLRTDTEELIEDLEDGDWWGEELDGFEFVDWTELTTGDGGNAILYETDYEGMSSASATFLTANATVNISYSLEGRYDEQEEFEFMTSFSEQLKRQLDKEADRG